jgi:hypothetical protein
MIGRLVGSLTHSLNHSIPSLPDRNSAGQIVLEHLVVQKPHGLVLDNSSSCHYIGYCFAPDGVQAKMEAIGDRTGSKAVP